jgi:glycerol-3-phosphate dehydrogenase
MLEAGVSDKHYDVAIIGGGINGASAAQHLAAAGYSVLLVEKGDFGSGATSRSSRLLHCGLRYLAPGRSILDFVVHPSRLVTALRMARQAMQARSDLVKTSPARTRPMQFCFPIFADGPYRKWQVEIAFRVLRVLGGSDLPLDYQLVSPEKAAAMPLVSGLRNFDRLKAVAVFREYQLDWPERICVDAVLDAKRLGADVRNYTLGRIVERRDENWIIELKSLRSAEQTVVVTAKAVLNTAGVWIDGINRAAAPRAKQYTYGTKGCHIVVKLPDACADIGIATLNSKHEPFYCIPWRGYHYFGPTETRFDGDKDEIAVTSEERAWLIAEANRLLPGLRLSDSDVVMTWAGVRPLTYDERMPQGNRARTIHDLSADGLPNVFAMTAGPVMTHRSAGQELADIIKRRMQPSKPPQAPSFAPRQFPDNQNSPPLLADHPAVKLADLRFAAREEHAETLMDVFFRRTGLGWDCALTDTELMRAADAIGEELGWDDARKQAEVAAYRDQAALLFNASRQLRPIAKQSDALRGVLHA